MFEFLCVEICFAKIVGDKDDEGIGGKEEKEVEEEKGEGRGRIVVCWNRVYKNHQQKERN